MALLIFLVPNFLVQGEEIKKVCIVYFTGYGCGDDCGLTDTLMDGLLSEYAGNLVSITYYVDSSQENQNVFQAYKNTYGLPQNVPIVLFGKNEYFQGIDDIYKYTESKIFSFLQMNGTNCPLDSGYIPPSQLGSVNLPGQPEVQIGGVNKTESDKNDGKTENITRERGGSGAAGQYPFLGIFAVDEPIKESLLSLVIIVVVLIVIGLIVLYIWEKSQESL